jgi:hypothetical protein
LENHEYHKGKTQINKIMNTKPLSESALIVSIKISKWKGRKFDRKVTNEVNSNHGTTDAGRFNKILVDKNEIKAITAKESEIRRYVNKRTLPWGDKGERVLYAPTYLDFMSGLKPIWDEFDKLSSDFVDKYNDHVEKARRELNGLFNADDYPSASEIGDKFNVNLDMTAMPETPDPNDFRITAMPEGSDEAVIEAIQSTISSRHEQAVGDIVKRAQTALNKVIEAIKRVSNAKDGDDIRFSQGLMDNIEELSKLIPSLNYTKSVKVDNLGTEIGKLVTDVDTLKSDPNVRSNYLTRAEKLSKMFF